MDGPWGRLASQEHEKFLTLDNNGGGFLNFYHQPIFI